ncbi:MAG: DUF1987 domain-containing protein [Bacteroidota bacterium]|nr:DUF1987 domain-containing protein [Bacteroidota bacterium]
MENLAIKSTTNTPGIECDFSSNQITIEGESRPENVRAFYAPLFTWIDGYENKMAAQSSAETSKMINLDLKLEYFNSSSLKIFMEVIDRLKKISDTSGKLHLSINWYHQEEDEDILDSGKEVEKMVGIKFNFISIP